MPTWFFLFTRNHRGCGSLVHRTVIPQANRMPAVYKFCHSDHNIHKSSQTVPGPTHCMLEYKVAGMLWITVE